MDAEAKGRSMQWKRRQCPPKKGNTSLPPPRNLKISIRANPRLKEVLLMVCESLVCFPGPTNLKRFNFKRRRKKKEGVGRVRHEASCILSFRNVNLEFFCKDILLSYRDLKAVFQVCTYVNHAS